MNTRMMGCGGSTVVSPKATEITLECSDGIRLAAQSWRAGSATASNRNHGSGEELRVLCLHGWMDNCQSFHYLAPALIEHLDASMMDAEENNDADTPDNKNNSGGRNGKRFQHVHVVALDLPGHGLSSHRSNDAPPMIRAEYLFYIAEAIRQLQWWKPQRSNNLPSMMKNGIQTPQPTKFVLVGHSMGAGVSLMYAAAFPEQVRQLILLDSVGHLARPVQSTSQNLRNFVQSRQLDGPLLTDPANRFYYPSVDAALQARCRSAQSFPGNQYISREAAGALVDRGLVEEEEEPTTAKRRFRFRHDPRLLWSSLCYLSEDQLDAIYRDIQCPTCILLGVDGWPLDEPQKIRVQEVLHPTVFKTLPGSHHFHADPDSAEAVVQEIVAFLQPT